MKSKGILLKIWLKLCFHNIVQILNNYDIQFNLRVHPGYATTSFIQCLHGILEISIRHVSMS